MSLKENQINETEISIHLLKSAKNSAESQTNSIPRSRSTCKSFKWRGVLFALISPVFFAMGNIFMRKCKQLNFSEIALIRYFIQLVIIIPINFKYKRNMFGEKGQRLLLSFRSFFNLLSVMFFYFSVQLINPSDSTALFNCCVIFVTIFARFFLKEKLTFVHLMALIVTMIGVFLISQPEFLFSKEKIANIGLNDFNSTLEYQNRTNSGYLKILGVCLALTASFAYTIVALITKKLSILKTHVTVICAYFSYFGLPGSFLVSLALLLTGFEKSSKDLFGDDEATRILLIWDVFFAVVSALLAFGGQTLTNMAMKIEDANRISLLESTGLIYSFIFQYLILDIKSNYLSTLGAMLIFIGAVCVLSYKIIDKKHQKKMEIFHLSNSSNKSSSKKSNRLFTSLKKIFFFKF